MNCSLEITTMIGCPLLCSICPQDKLKSVYAGDKYLTIDNFKIVIDKLPLDVRIIFSGYSEAWANPHATQMLEYALEKNFNVDVFTTLYGMTDVDKVIHLIQRHKAQIGQIWLHLPDRDNNMLGYKENIEYKKCLKKFLVLNPYLMTMSDSNSVHSSLDEFNLTLSDWKFHTRAENIKRSDKNVKLNNAFNNEFMVECVRNNHLTDNVLLPNGNVTLCCMDYNNKHILGNLLTQTYNEVIGNVAEIKRKNHILFDKSTLCRTCQDTYHKTPWNDEEVHQRILNIIKKELF